MDYQKIYDLIIEKAKKENRKRNKEIYYEEHHIIPKCLNGTNDKENKVFLTAKEHFVVHKLLVKMFPSSNGIKLSFYRMCFCRSKNQQRIIPSARDYQYAKELDREAKKGNKNCIGKKHPHSEETKNKLRNYFRENLPEYSFKKGQIPWNIGMKTPDNIKEKISNSCRGKKRNPFSEKHRKKLSESRIGMKFSEEHRKNISKNNGSKNPEVRKKISESLRKFNRDK
jgi:hypothetical protein